MTTNSQLLTTEPKTKTKPKQTNKRKTNKQKTKKEKISPGIAKCPFRDKISAIKESLLYSGI